MHHVVWSVPTTCSFVVHAHDTAWPTQLEQQFPTSCRLESLTYSCDVAMEDAEFCYLVDLKEGQEITHHDLVRAVTYLFKKNKFETITVELIPTSSGCAVHIALKSFWTFERLRFHGWMLGKEKYRTHYVLEPGQRFDEGKHKASVRSITDQLAQEGFFNARVTSYCDYDYLTKSVRAHIVLYKGEQFTVGTVNIIVQEDQPLPEYDRQALLQIMHKKLVNGLQGVRYTKALLNAYAAERHELLVRKGFLHNELTLHEKIDKKRKRVDLTFTVTVRAKKELIFVGNRFLSGSQLRERLLLFGRSAWLLPASILSEELMRAYHAKGFWHTTIEAREQDGSYFFIINEGPRVSVASCELRNMHAFDARYNGRYCFAELRKSAYFDQTLLEKGMERLTQMYVNAGFWDATIVRHTFVPLQKKQQYTLQVIIDEGMQSVVRSVSIPGYESLVALDPFALHTKKETPTIFTPQVLNEQRLRLIHYFVKRGYPHVQVKPDIVRDGSSVDITWHIETYGTQMHFGKSIIQGCSTFPFHAIMRELAYKEGDVWYKDTIKKTHVKLWALDTFSSVHLSPSPAAHDPRFNDISINLQKDDPFEVRLRAGFELEHLQKQWAFGGLTYRAGGSFIMKNPFNRGGVARLDTDFTRVHREIVARYIRPWIGSLPVRTTFQLYAIKHDQPGFKSFKNLYQLRQEGFLVGLSRELRRGALSMNVGCEWMETSISDKTPEMARIARRVARAINFNMALLDKHVPYFFIEPVVYLDLLDNKLEPTKGTLTVISVKAMIPLRFTPVPTHCIKLFAEQAFFIPMHPFVVALRLRLGHICKQALSNIMPSERFYLGGAHSIRSYETDYAPPLGIFEDENDKLQAVAQGGRSMINANVELRFPLYHQMGGVFFQDVGALSSNRFTDIKVKDILAGSGFGLRYNTPMGPLRFDIGFKWHVIKPLERSFAWFLTLGQAF